MNATQTIVQLANGQSVSLRIPRADKDLEPLVAFFTSLPPKIRNTLRVQATDPAVTRGRLAQIDEHNHWRIIAEIEGQIVGEGTLDREPFGWTRHVAHVRCTVDPQKADLGIENLVLRQLVDLGAAAGIERFFTEVLEAQSDRIEALKAAGFEYEATRHKYAKDYKGRLHNVVVLSSDFGHIWRSLRDTIDEQDIQLHRIHGGA